MVSSFPTYPLPLPRFQKLRVGIFGGSFNPPHAGHMATAHHAYRVLALDYVLFMITPQNPLKKNAASDVTIRLSWIKEFSLPRYFIPTAFEQDFGFYYSYQTFAFLHKTYPMIEFIIILGADGVRSLPLWRKYPFLLKNYQFAIMARPQEKYNVTNLPAFKRAKNMIFVQQPHRPESSTMIRNNQKIG